MSNLPIYKAIITDDIDGITAISIVENPAVETDFLKFNKQNKDKLLFNVVNEEERIIVGVIMRANFPIYRVNDYGYEYYVIYEEDTIKLMAQKMLKDNAFNRINLEHNNNMYVNGVEMRELFIKNNERGITPKGFEDIEDGSLFATYKVLNEGVWRIIKNGEFKGFSLEGYFTMNEKLSDDDKLSNDMENNDKVIDTIEDLLNHINNNN